MADVRQIQRLYEDGNRPVDICCAVLASLGAVMDVIHELPAESRSLHERRRAVLDGWKDDLSVIVKEMDRKRGPGRPRHTAKVGPVAAVANSPDDRNAEREANPPNPARPAAGEVPPKSHTSPAPPSVADAAASRRSASASPSTPAGAVGASTVPAAFSRDERPTTSPRRANGRGGTSAPAPVHSGDPLFAELGITEADVRLGAALNAAILRRMGTDLTLWGCAWPGCAERGFVNQDGDRRMFCAHHMAAGHDIPRSRRVRPAVSNSPRHPARLSKQSALSLVR